MKNSLKYIEPILSPWNFITLWTWWGGKSQPHEQFSWQGSQHWDRSEYNVLLEEGLLGDLKHQALFLPISEQSLERPSVYPWIKWLCKMEAVNEGPALTMRACCPQRRVCVGWRAGGHSFQPSRSIARGLEMRLRSCFVLPRWTLEFS